MGAIRSIWTLFLFFRSRVGRGWWDGVFGEAVGLSPACGARQDQETYADLPMEPGEIVGRPAAVRARSSTPPCARLRESPSTAGLFERTFGLK